MFPRPSTLLVGSLVLTVASAFFLPPNTAKTTWDSARSRCQAEGSDLAIVRTQADLDEILDLVGIYSNDGRSKDGWIGLRQSPDGSGVFKWVDGSDLVNDYFNGAPNNLATEFCVEHTRVSPAAVHSGIAWNNLNCGRDRTPICGLGQPLCNLPPSQWLTTEFMPELDVTNTGFNTGVKDLFQVVFSYHRKYFDVVPSSDGLTVAGGELEASVVENSPSGCYDTHTVKVAWADLVTKCSRSEEGGASGFVVYTCKIEIDAKETLEQIRDSPLTREIHNEMPFIVKFPKQVSASVTNLSAFKPVNLLAAVIRQEVHLDVSAVTDIDAKITLFTSVQYPFRLNVGSEDLVSLPANIVEDSFANSADCVDPEVADSPNPAVDDANACSQQWLLDLQVDATTLCEIDGDYKVTFEAECQPFFAASTDCPLLKDDQGEASTTFTVDFVIDSENFCAVVVDSVDLRASVAVFKDHSHIVAATNFIEQQTAYFVATAESDKVTIVKVSVDDVDVDITGGAAAGHYDLFTDGAIGAVGTAVTLVVEDSVANGNPDQAWFQFIVDAAVFQAPADGSADFDVSVTLNVEFKDAQGVLLSYKERVDLLQVGKSQAIAANVNSAFTAAGSDTDSETAPAATLSLAAATALAGVGSLAL